MWSVKEAEDFWKSIVRDQNKRIEKYRKDIIDLRGKAHLGCPNCADDCVGWIVDGKPCGEDW